MDTLFPLRYLILSLFLFSALVSGCGDSGNSAANQPQPLPVKVAKPLQEEVALTEIFTGRFEPVESVELRARVSGYIESVHFKEGQKVKKGDLMFQIDPRPFDAALDAAEARTRQAEARVSLAEGNMKRTDKLIQSGGVSQEEAEIRRSEFAQAKADLLAAQASERSARLDREFADVKAPISGIASDYHITPGNFISGGTPGSDLLTTIMPHTPIYAEFEVDERQVLKFTRMFFEGKTDGRGGEQPPVKIAVSDSDEFEFEGVIDFSDNRLDESTATSRLRALVKNENEFLTPGLFARVQIPIGSPFDAILVRDSALGFDQDKRFAWVLGEENIVQRRFVEVGALQGAMRIVEKGLVPDERVIVSGIQLLRDGVPVAPTEVPMRAEKSPGKENEKEKQDSGGEAPAKESA
ncbi:MAG: efflux RND transporter periplasmic adaptor subunit [Verrucomicrobiales bacterium]|nr:efflux RND transporter periplasmic adaptor subunit [Verrucomicrobiales bacterium]